MTPGRRQLALATQYLPASRFVSNLLRARLFPRPPRIWAEQLSCLSQLFATSVSIPYHLDKVRMTS